MTSSLRAEESLPESSFRQRWRECEEHLHALIHDTSDVVFSHDRSGRFLALNPAAEQRLGYQSSEIAGQEVWSVIALDSRKTAEALIEQSLLEGTVAARGELEFVTREGGRLRVDLRMRPLRQDGQVVGLEGIGRPVTEQELPIYSLVPAVEPEAERDEELPFAGRRVLVVEDAEADSWMLKRTLGKEGWDVSVAQTGKEALRFLSRETFDYAIVDLGLPDMDGEDILRELRRKSGSPRVLVHTGHLPTSRKAKVLMRYAHQIVIKDSSSPHRLPDILKACMEAPEEASSA